MFSKPSSDGSTSILRRCASAAKRSSICYPAGLVYKPERAFGTIKLWMGYTHFQMKTLKRVGTEMALHVLAYNLKRLINIIGIVPLIAAIRAA